MDFVKNIRFSLVVVCIVFFGSVLASKIIDTTQEQKPLLQDIFDKTDALIHDGITQHFFHKGADYISDDSYALSDGKSGLSSNAISQIAGTIKHGETIDTSLRRQNISAEIRSTIIDALRDKLDFRRIKPEDNYTLRIDGNGQLASFSYELSPLDVLTIRSSNDGYLVKKEPIELERKKVKISGEITSSLFAAFKDKDEDMRLVYAFADIFSTRIDFNTEIRPGDRFSLVVDKYYKNDQLIGYGKIEAAQYYRTNGTKFEAYLTTDAKGKDVYLNQFGESDGSSFLRSPVPIGKVSSKFTYQRRHPITGQIKPHLGVDLSAPIGTPIMAVADGRIVELGDNGGFGKQIVIAHSGDYKTYYGHLSRFKGGLHRGSIVSKKDIIGYVGSSGMSTGPHLDYRIQHHMVFQDPFGTKFKIQIALDGKELKKFQERCRQLAELADFNAFTPYTQILKVSSLTINNKDHNITLL